MPLKNLLIWLVRSLIILFLATLIFSATTMDFPSVARGIFSDIYDYSSQDVQKEAIAKLAETCSALEKGNAVSMQQVCVNESLLSSMRENCENYRELKKRNVEIENEAKVMETCDKLQSGEIEKACNEIKEKNSLLPDLSGIGASCKRYKEGNISDKEFFFNVVSSPFSNNVDLPKAGFFEKYNKALNYLNKNKMLYFLILGILVAALYFLINDSRLFLIALGDISFSIGILITLPYFIILAYDKLVGINTTSVLGGIFGIEDVFDFKAVLSVILLLFLKTYNNFVITTGALFLAVGIAGKVSRFILKRELKKGLAIIKKRRCRSCWTAWKRIIRK